MTYLQPTRTAGFAFATTPFLMLYLCLSGMAVGLAIDCGAIPPATIATLCTGAGGSFLANLAFHWSVLPATHTLMLLGALVAAAMAEMSGEQVGHSPRRLLAHAGTHGACILLMLAGMTLGGILALPAAAALGFAPGFAALIAGMVAGMATGMALSMPLYRWSPFRLAAWR